MSANPRRVEDREGHSRETTDVNVVGGKASSLADRVVVGELDVRQVLVPIGLAFVHGNGQHLRHRMINPFRTTIGLGVVGAGGHFTNTHEVVDGGRELGTEVRSVVGQKGSHAAPFRHVLIDQHIGSATRSEVCGGDSVHVGTSAEAVGEQKDVRIATRRNRQRSEVVHSHYHARATGQGQGQNRPSNSLTRSFPCLTGVASTNPGTHRSVETDPPVEALDEAGGAVNTQVFGRFLMADPQNPGAKIHRNVYTRSAIIGRPGSGVGGAHRGRSRFANQKRDTLISGMQAGFGGEQQNICETGDRQLRRRGESQQIGRRRRRRAELEETHGR